ncbi:MAG: GxxExxY protein [Treponema sp.]|nr:GxxExxY protein [Treponema sp.]
MDLNELSYKIRGAVYKVYNVLGPGLLESVYEEALFYQLILDGLDVKRQLLVPIVYNDFQLNSNLRIDLLVENQVIIELKSVDIVLPVHHKQLVTYLKLTNKKLGLLINFNSEDINKSIYRKVNKL